LFVAAFPSEFGFVLKPDTTDADLNDIEKSYLRSGVVFKLLFDCDDELVATVGVARLDKQRREL
jgi:hypothetical protein